MNPCQVCGEAFDVHEPAAGTRADATPSLLRMEPDLTVFMLRVAALRIGLPIESVPLSELGFDVPKA